jgi:hypothetical protein
VEWGKREKGLFVDFTGEKVNALALSDFKEFTLSLETGAPAKPEVSASRFMLKLPGRLKGRTCWPKLMLRSRPSSRDEFPRLGKLLLLSGRLVRIAGRIGMEPTRSSSLSSWTPSSVSLFPVCEAERESLSKDLSFWRLMSSGSSARRLRSLRLGQRLAGLMGSLSNEPAGTELAPGTAAKSSEKLSGESQRPWTPEMVATGVCICSPSESAIQDIDSSAAVTTNRRLGVPAPLDKLRIRDPQRYTQRKGERGKKRERESER